MLAGYVRSAIRSYIMHVPGHLFHLLHYPFGHGRLLSPTCYHHHMSVIFHPPVVANVFLGQLDKLSPPVLEIGTVP